MRPARQEWTECISKAVKPDWVVYLGSEIAKVKILGSEAEGKFPLKMRDSVIEVRGGGGWTGEWLDSFLASRCTYCCSLPILLPQAAFALFREKVRRRDLHAIERLRIHQGPERSLPFSLHVPRRASFRWEETAATTRTTLRLLASSGSVGMSWKRIVEHPFKLHDLETDTNTN